MARAVKVTLPDHEVEDWFSGFSHGELADLLMRLVKGHKDLDDLRREINTAEKDEGL